MKHLKDYWYTLGVEPALSNKIKRFGMQTNRCLKKVKFDGAGMFVYLF